jgi:hypothetical protein
MPTGSSESKLAGLKAALKRPPARIAAQELAALFRVETVTATARRPAGFADYPDLPIRVRGAVGGMLHALAAPVSPRPGRGEWPRAWDVLMEPMGYDVARPMTVQTDVRANQIAAHVRLVGHAGFWRPCVETALITAFDHGVKLTSESRFRTQLEVESVHQSVFGGYEPLQGTAREGRLYFESPVRLRSGHATRMSGPSFLISLANRVKSLAPWFGFTLDEDWSGLHEAAWAIESDENGLWPYRYERGSRRAEARIPVLGLLGVLVLRGNLERFTPYLQIGEAVNAGSHAALGFGRYRLSLLP